MGVGVRAVSGLFRHSEEEDLVLETGLGEAEDDAVDSEGGDFGILH